MERNKDLAGIPQMPQEHRPELIHKSGIRTRELRELLGSIVKKDGKSAIMEYIESNVEGATSIVVDDWLNRGIVPSAEIQQGVISAVENFSRNNTSIVNDVALPVSKKETYKKTSLLKKTRLQGRIEDNEQQLEVLQKRAEEKRKDKKTEEEILKAFTERLERERPEREQAMALEEKMRKEGKIT
jgi:hypothetical protein